MRLLIFTHAFAPTLGGVETVVARLAGGLSGPRDGASGRPVEVVVVTRTSAQGCDDTAFNFQVIRRPDLLRLMRLMRTADIVHLAGPNFLPLLLGLLLRKRVIVEHHGFQAICPNGQMFYEPTGRPCPGHFMAGRHRECLRCNAMHGALNSAKLWLLTFPRRWLLRRAAANLTPTRWLASQLGLPRTITIPHGVEPRAAASTSDSGVDSRSFVYVGRLVSTKGVDVLLDAAARLKTSGMRFRVNIVGEGPERRRLETKMKALHMDDCVAFLGKLTSNELDCLLERAAAIVVPSLGGEVFGLVAAESMMRGRLVVVSDLGTFDEVVGEAGLKFPTGDPLALADRLAQVLASPGLALQKAQEARSRALQLFAERQMVAGHLRVYAAEMSRGACGSRR